MSNEPPTIQAGLLINSWKRLSLPSAVQLSATQSAPQAAAVAKGDAGTQQRQRARCRGVIDAGCEGNALDWSGTVVVGEVERGTGTLQLHDKAIIG